MGAHGGSTSVSSHGDVRNSAPASGGEQTPTAPIVHETRRARVTSSTCLGCRRAHPSISTSAGKLVQRRDSNRSVEYFA